MTSKHYNSLKATLIAFLLCAIFLPFARLIAPRAIIEGQALYLAWLPLSVMLALMLIFGRRAIAGIIITLALVNYNEWQLSLMQNTVLVACQAVPLFLCCALVRLMLGTRWRVGLPNKWMGIRIFWLGFVAPGVMKLAMVLAGRWVAFPDAIASYFVSESVLFRIVDTLSLIVASLIFTMAFYFPLRMILTPRYARTLWRACLVPCFSRKNRHFVMGWLIVLSTLLIFLCSPHHAKLFSGYLVPAIFVVFTMGIRRLGHRLILFCWAISAWLLLTWNYNFLLGMKSEYALSFVLSVFVSFTICMLYMTNIFRRSAWVTRLWQEQALTDPLTQLPNLRALERSLIQSQTPWLCCLRMNNLEFLSRHYGMMMRVHCKVTINQLLQPWLQEGECVFQLPGNELLISLTGPAPEARLSHIVDLLNSQKICWNNNWLEIEFSAAWAVADTDVASLQPMLGQLSYLAEQASAGDRVLSLNARQAVVTGQTSGQVLMLQKVKRALDEGSVMLYAQPIVDADGQGYHEILSRLVCDGEMLTPDRFIPIIAQFNLSDRFDLLVVETMLAWLQAHPHTGSGARFSVNLMPFTLMRKDTAQHIITLFRRYAVPIAHVIVEITEEQAFSHSETSIQNITVLREAGFKIAIDDFGTGYANYERLKRLQANIIKIDGCFVKDILTDSMDAMIVKSICEMARVKSLCVVAEYVETAAQRDLLLSLGVDYLQGWYTGKPQPLVELRP